MDNVVFPSGRSYNVPTPARITQSECPKPRTKIRNVVQTPASAIRSCSSSADPSRCDHCRNRPSLHRGSRQRPTPIHLSPRTFQGRSWTPGVIYRTAVADSENACRNPASTSEASPHPVRTEKPPTLISSARSFSPPLASLLPATSVADLASSGIRHEVAPALQYSPSTRKPPDAFRAISCSGSFVLNPPP